MLPDLPEVAKSSTMRWDDEIGGRRYLSVAIAFNNDLRNQLDRGKTVSNLGSAMFQYLNRRAQATVSWIPDDDKDDDEYLNCS
ncbi:hypothetical protein C356_02070 [Cryptococcus neoformans c45]|nr:hypothetical protein C356_02070 [Cryptococcus neoformans var. grubii c45]